MKSARVISSDPWQKLLETIPTLLAVTVGALASLGASWFLQNRQFKRQRLDQTRERVYGPLAWELKRMQEQVADFELSPTREVAEKIRNLDHLEWMIESRELRRKIAELYDIEIPKYRDIVHNVIQEIHMKLQDDISRSCRSTSSEIRTIVHDVVYGLGLPVLRAKLPDTPDSGRRRSDYQRLFKLAKPQYSSLDDYFSRAMTICEPERAKAEEAKKNLQEKIKQICGELEKLLRPD